MAANKFFSRMLYLVNTVQRKLPDDPEGDFSSDLLYSGDGPIAVLDLCSSSKKAGAGAGGDVCNLVGSLSLPAKVSCAYG